MKRISPILPLFFLALVIFVSGCTAGLDPQALATSNSLIKQFMADHPNAKILATHYTAEQSKSIIDQVRKDCENPYLDEKEYYKITISDNQTGFYATVWVDWQNKTIECAYKLGNDGVVIDKPIVTENCTAHSYSECFKGNIYWFDSCGKLQDKKEYCQGGCSENKCQGDCVPNAKYGCYGGHVYWFDSCGNVQSKKEYCNYGCDSGVCNPQPVKNSCEQAGGYCIWAYTSASATATASSSSGGGGGSLAKAESGVATGMIIAQETTQSSTTVSYQCKAGYSVSTAYYCTSGGLCCLPTSQTTFCGKSTDGSCTSDDGCITGGCSGEICQSKSEEPAITTCIYSECYNSDNYGLGCKCVSGQCQWSKATAPPIACAQDMKVCPNGVSVSRNPAKNCEFDCPVCGNGICESGEADVCSTCASDSPACQIACKAGTCAEDCFKGCPAYSPPGPDWCKGGTVTSGGTDSSGCPLPPKCVTSTCTDSDGGKDYYVRGTVLTNPPTSMYANGSFTPITDICDNTFANMNLREYYCDINGKVQSVQFNCSYGCKDGACVKPSNTCSIGTDCPSQMKCENSTCVPVGCIAEGQTGPSAGINPAYLTHLPTQCCSGLTPITYSGYYDSNCNPVTNIVGAPTGVCTRCGDGVCGKGETACNCPQDCKVATTCTDSDGGKNYYVKGLTNGSAPAGSYYEAEDACMTGNAQPGQLAEHYCDQNSKHTFEIYQCPHGCQNGSCTYPICGDGYCESVTCTVNGCPKAETMQNCPDDCASNAACYSNADCHSVTGEKYCDAGNASCYTTTNYKCENPGSPNAECVPGSSSGYCDVCHNGCSNGACIQQAGSIDCGENIDCMISASGSCSPSKANYTASTSPAGINQTVKTYMEILGSNVSSGKCVFFLRTENIDLIFPPGTPQQTIDQYTQAYSQLQGRYGTCQFNNSDLTGALTAWKLSGLFTPAQTANCQGSYFNQSL